MLFLNCLVDVFGPVVEWFKTADSKSADHGFESRLGFRGVEKWSSRIPHKDEIGGSNPPHRNLNKYMSH